MTFRFDPIYNNLATGSSVQLMPFPYIGFVKRNDDPQHMGRLAVWIPEICGDPTQESSWLICSYCSMFAGATNISSIPNYQGNPNVGQQSYGWVGVPPDLNSEVMVVFVGGDLARAYWTGCTYQQNMNHMVPGIAADVTTESGTPPPVAPTIEYNKSAVLGSPSGPRRPPFVPLANGLSSEGLMGDDERGVSSTSMRRESPPLVYGWLTPRGNTVHVDDNSSNEFVRFRTRSGVQILIHETTGYVYINSKNGNSWFEISDAGIDGYTANSISLRAQQDFNIRADRNIILDAGSNIFLRAGKQITMDAGSNIEAGAASNIVLSAGATGSFKTTGDLLVNSGGALRFQSAADTTSLAGGDWIRQATLILDNGTAPPANANAAQVPTAKAQLDTTQTYANGAGSGSSNWRYGSGTVSSIVSRMPTHEPWGGHPNSKVPPPPLTNIGVNYAGNYNAGNGGGNSASNTYPDGSLNNSGCSFGVANTTPISTDVYNAITAAADKTGADPATMLAFADVESSFRPGVGAGTSSAAGLYQITSGTWNGLMNKYGNQYNIPNTPSSIYDPNYNALMGGQLLQDDNAALKSQGITSPTPGQLYLLHFLGQSGGSSFISQNQNDPNASAASLFPAAASANPSIFYNSDGSSKTVGQVYNNLTTKVDTKAEAYASQYGLPPPCQRGNGTQGNTPSTPATVAPNLTPASFTQDAGKVYGNGQCVALVQQVAGVPTTANWVAGAGNILTNPPPVGTPIATFGSNGTYTNSVDGTSHAAIYLGPSPSGNGILVLDQYLSSSGSPQPAQIRTIYVNPAASIVNNAANYHVINVTGS